MHPLRLGVIGCGVIGSKHIEAAAASPRIDLVAVADLRADVAQQLAQQHGVDRVYDSGAALIGDPDIEAVVLAMPAHIRKELALRAFAAGKHVLTEKPVALHSGEVEEMIAARGDLVAGCCSARFHFLQASRTVADFVASGALGQLRLVRCRAVVPAGAPPQQPPPPWRLSRALNGGGIMSNWGCYDLDYLLGVTGWSLQPRVVLAQTWRVPPVFQHYAAPDSDAETHVAALIRCADGITITYERTEFVAARAERAWEIIGEAGSVSLQMVPQAEGENTHFHADATVGTRSETLCASAESTDAIHDGPVNDFAIAVRTGRTPQTSLERALVIQRITDAIYASAQNGDAVQI